MNIRMHSRRTRVILADGTLILGLVSAAFSNSIAHAASAPAKSESLD